MWENSNLFTVAYERAVYLTDIRPAIVIPDVLSAYRDDEGCKIRAHGEADLRINGEPFNGEIILKNHDLIHNHDDLRIVFDADPANAFAEVYVDDESPLPEEWATLKITPRIEEFVRITSNGLSLDGGKNLL